MKRLLALTLAVLMIVSLFAACGKKDNGGEEAAKTYTYNTYMSALGDNWNPHTWETNADDTMKSYLETPLVDISIKDSSTGEYQWIFVAATDIQDVTAQHKDDLVKFNCAQSDASAGYVYEISLRPEMKWENGTPINADTYIYSMKALLDPDMRNYRAGTYLEGDGALAGASLYYNSGAPIYDVVISYVENPEFNPDDENSPESIPEANVDLENTQMYLNLDAGNMTMASYSFAFMLDYFVTEDLYKSLDEQADPFGWIAVTEENQEDVITIMDQYLQAFSMSMYDENGEVIWDYYYEFLFYFTEQYGESYNFEDVVGLYKVDEYTIRYVCETAYDYYYFLTSCTSNWLVYEELYEAGKDTTGTLVTTNYATSKETSMSYGAYKIDSLQKGKQIVYVQNENYWEYSKNADGSLSSVSFFQVDGKNVAQYQTQKIVIDVMTDDAAKLAFLAGELDDWAPSADDMSNYVTSDQLYQVDQTYTMRLFFNDNLDSLKKMDEAGNQNSVVMSNYKFRQAFSLAINRADWVTATTGYKPAYYLLNSLYFYDVYEDPSSIYRNTDEAMQAICDLYGVEYGEGTPYENLQEAYESINGFNLTEAKALFSEACDELVAAGLYNEGDNIVIKVAWAKGSMDSSAKSQVALLNKHLNAALEGTGFGSINLEAVDNIPDRYGDVVKGVYAIGYGAWGGAAFYPFNAIGSYTDAEYAGTIHESGSWDPAITNLTLNINGEEITMSYEAWTQSLTGVGSYANAEAAGKLQILAAVEKGILEQYHCIPLATDCVASMLSYKLSYYTENYNIMYGFGGLRLMSYNYHDAEWASYVSSQNGELVY